MARSITPQVPFYQRWFSYLKPVVLELRSTDLNPDLTVELVNGKLQLCSGNAIYSFDDKYENFVEAFKKINLPDRKLEVLVLGLGLGSVPLILEHTFDREYNYTAVELDEDVVELASKYTLPRLESTLDCVIANALSYILMTDQSYDMIIMDVFKSDVIPPEFQTKEFLWDLSKRLKNDGLLLYNRMDILKKEKENNQIFYNLFQTVFPTSESLSVHKNVILISNAAWLK